MSTEQLDQIFDYIIYGTIGVCFTAAIIFITKAVIDSINGWNPVTPYLWNAGILIALGIAVSLFLFYVKSWSRS